MLQSTFKTTVKTAVALAVILFFCEAMYSSLHAQPRRYDPITVDVVRDFGGELFMLNSLPYVDPLIRLLNATANSRFFHTAEVARKNKFYVRVGIHGMASLVNADQKTYTPVLPTATFDIARAAQYINLVPPSIRDTAGIVGYAARVIIGDGIQSGQIQVPSQAATFFGSISQNFTVPKAYFRQRLQNPAAGDPLALLSPAARTSILPYIDRLPNELPLPTGQNLSALPLVVPQAEIGSLWGTELLVRFLPQIDWGNNIGNFGFWGVGLKHSLSQYIQDAPIEVAAQATVQGTTLTNTIGVTGAKLRADATTFNANIHASKRWGVFELYGGVSYDYLNINASYTFTLPIQIQAQLGLVNPDGQVDPANGYPGDTKPQTKSITIPNTNIRGIVGMALNFGPVAIFLDYSAGGFNIFSGGLDVKF